MRAAFEPPTDAGAYGFCHRVRVRFAETDAMGVVHHAAYLPYLEAARVEFLRSVGRPVRCPDWLVALATSGSSSSSGPVAPGGGMR